MAGIRTLTVTPIFPIDRTAVTKTNVVDFENTDLFSAQNRGARPSYRFEFTTCALNRLEVESLSAFHHLHMGGKSFFWSGYPYNTVENFQTFDEGVTGKLQFYLPNRNIGASSLRVQTRNPSTGATSLWVVGSANGWPYSLNPTPGIISFSDSASTIPVSGADIQAIYACQYRVTFEPDGFKTSLFAGGMLWRAQLKLRESSGL